MSKKPISSLLWWNGSTAFCAVVAEARRVMSRSMLIMCLGLACFLIACFSYRSPFSFS